MRSRISVPPIAALLALCSAPAWSATTTFTDSYMGSGSGAACDTAYAISGVAPDDGVQHPLFIYLVGTSETYNNAQAMAAVKGMAARGFVAATVQYHSEVFGTCSDIAKKAACVFKPSSTNSAVSKLCVRGDCSKGIVVGGFSQGSIVSILAKNTEPRVKAAYGMGALNAYGTYNMAACMNNGKHKLAAKNLRIVNGEKDFFGGGMASRVRVASIAVTAKSCASSAYSCLNANGSGWLMVRNNEVTDKSADHCYQRKSNDCFGSESIVDPKWQTGRASWALPANMNWLKTFAMP